MRKCEFEKVTYAIRCLMNGGPESCDYNPEVGTWDDGMNALDNLRRQYIKERKKERKKKRRKMAKESRKINYKK
jgi:hypothetical protein